MGNDVIQGPNFDNLLELLQFNGFLYEYAFKKAFLEHIDASLIQVVKEDFVDKYPQKTELIEYLDKHFSLEQFKQFNKADFKNILYSTFFVGFTGYLQGYTYIHFLQQCGTQSKIELKKYDMKEGGTIGSYTNADLIFIQDRTLYIIDFKLNGAVRIFDYIINTKLKEDNEITLPIYNFGMSVGFSVENTYFDQFCKQILQLKDKIKQTKIFEIKSYMQVSSYASSYLLENDDYLNYLDSIYLGIFYPLGESLSLKFMLRDHPEYKNMYREMINLYGAYVPSPTLKQSYIPLLRGKDEEMSADLTQITLEDVQNRLEHAQNMIHLLESTETELEVEPIESVRENIKEILRTHWDEAEENIMVLLHSAGAGKTTSTLKQMLEHIKKHQDGINIIFYFSPRKKINDQMKKRFQKMIEEENDLPFEIIFADQQESNDSDNKNQTQRIYKMNNRASGVIVNSWQKPKKGQVRNNRDILLSLIKQKTETNKPRNFFVINTTQALVNVSHATEFKKKFHTITHIKGLIDILGNNYENTTINLFFIIDEFLGASNGLDLLEKFIELITFIKTIKKDEDNSNNFRNIHMYTFFLDANGCSANIIEKLNKHYRKTRAIPPSLIPTKFQQQSEYIIHNDAVEDDIKIKSYTKLGYPLNHNTIKVRRRFWIDISFTDEYRVYENAKEKEVQRIAQYIQEVTQDGGALVFIQNKHLINQIKEKLRKIAHNKKIATFTALEDQKALEHINNSDILLATSAISRGVNIENPSVKHVILVINTFHIEDFLVELLQIISRLRGTKEVENTPKTFHFVYYISDTYHFLYGTHSTIMEHIYSEEFRQAYDELVRKDLEAYYHQGVIALDNIITKIIQSFLKTPQEGEAIFVPIPRQTSRGYTPTTIESIQNFIDSLANLQKTNKYDLKNIITLIQDKFLLYTVDNVDIDQIWNEHAKKRIIDVIMPYIVMRSKYSNIWSFFTEHTLNIIQNEINKIKKQSPDTSTDKNFLEFENHFYNLKTVFSDVMDVSIAEQSFVLFIPIYMYVLQKFLPNDIVNVRFSSTINRETLDVLNLRGYYTSQLTSDSLKLSNKMVAIPITDVVLGEQDKLPSSEFPKLPTLLIEKLLENDTY